jgi:hypothetical protein
LQRLDPLVTGWKTRLEIYPKESLTPGSLHDSLCNGFHPIDPLAPNPDQLNEAQSNPAHHENP